MNIHVHVLRGLLLKLERRMLEKLYVTYICPILEYRGVIWCNCTQEEAERRGKVQLSAARIACGIKKGTIHEAIY